MESSRRRFHQIQRIRCTPATPKASIGGVLIAYPHLNPGDVIATGSPAGVGMPRGEFLKAGDEVRIEIEGCGTLVNRMVADDAPDPGRTQL